MRISLIAAFYKDIEALQLIISSLRAQDYCNFEFIIAEDNDDPAISDYLASIRDIDIIHTSQKDDGLRKARSINNAIIESTGDYLIFIDADCIPYRSFLSSHAVLAEKKHVLSGRRVNLGPRISDLLRNNRLTAAMLEKYYLFFLPLLLADGATHVEQGLSFKPDGFIYQRFIQGRKKAISSFWVAIFLALKATCLPLMVLMSYIPESPASQTTPTLTGDFPMSDLNSNHAKWRPTSFIFTTGYGSANKLTVKQP